MKKFYFLSRFVAIIILLQMTISCSDGSETETSDVNTTTPDWKCGTHNGSQLWTGPKGGCYYYNSNNNKTYVDRSECKC